MSVPFQSPTVLSVSHGVLEASVFPSPEPLSSKARSQPFQAELYHEDPDIHLASNGEASDQLRHPAMGLRTVSPTWQRGGARKRHRTQAVDIK